MKNKEQLKYKNKLKTNTENLSSANYTPIFKFFRFSPNFSDFHTKLLKIAIISNTIQIVLYKNFIQILLHFV